MKHYALVAAMLALSACAGNVPEDGSSPDDKLYVIAQVCVRSPFAKDILGFSTVREGSMGGGAARQLGTTLADQPVYQNFTAPRRQVRAILVWFKYEHQFVFQPPSQLPLETWTEWQSPEYASDNNAGFQILSGRSVKNKLPVTDTAPQIRYRLMSFNDYLSWARAERENKPTALPAC